MSDRRDDHRLRVALLGNAGVLVLTLLALGLLAPSPADSADPGEAGRLVLAARLSAWPALVLLFAMMLVTLARVLARALNPIDDAESRFYRVTQRALANTVEQTLIFLPALWALSVLIPPGALGWPGLLTATFVLGRALFIAGYLLHPYARAPGMAVTLTVNIVMVGWVVWLAA